MPKIYNVDDVFCIFKIPMMYFETCNINVVIKKKYDVNFVF